MVHVSTNELRYLRELFNEIGQEVDHPEIVDAIAMLDGLIEEGRKLTEARLNQILDEHKALLARSKEANEKTTKA